MEVRLHRGIESCRHFQADWLSLWGESPLRSVYNHPRWFYCQRDVGREALIVTAHDGSALVGLIPFVQKPWKWSLRMGPVHVASVPVKYCALSGGGALVRERRFTLVERMLDRLFSEKPSDVYYLENLNTNSFIDHALRDSPKLLASHVVHTVTPPTPHWLISLPGSIEKYKASLTSKFRGELKRKYKSLETACDQGLNLEIFGPESNLDRFHHQLGVVVRKSWQSGTLGLSIGESERLLVKGFAREGWFRGYVLSNGETPIAVEIDNILDGQMFAEVAAYDLSWSAHQPGKALQMKIIEDACALGLKSIDLGTGDHAYKRAFADLSYQEHNVYVVARKARLTLLRRTDTLLQVARDLARKAAEETQTTTLLRRKLRRAQQS